MKLNHLWFIAAVGLVSLVPGRADADFTQSVSHAYAAKTSLKVTEPAGFKVAVTVDGKTSEDTVPHVFPMADHDAYVPVTITAPDGKQWSGKIEIKAHQQTQLAFKYSTAPGASPNTPAGRKFIGHLINSADRCAPQARFAMRYDLLDEHGANVHSVQLNPGEDKTAEVPPGTYTVRIFWYVDGAWKYQDTAKGVQVTDDKWAFGLGCRKANGTDISRTR